MLHQKPIVLYLYYLFTVNTVVVKNFVNKDVHSKFKAVINKTRLKNIFDMRLHICNV